MNAIEICSSDDRERWLEMRRAGIGGSDAAPILGACPFKSELAVYAEKLGLSEDAEETEAMRWGRILEGPIIQEFGIETKRDVERAGYLLQSKDRPWMLTTLDGEQRSTHKREPGTIQAKATGWRAGDWIDGMPRHVWVQMQHEFAATGYTWGSVVVLIRGCKLLWADVERDSKFIDEILIPTEAEFWRRVQAREPVLPDGSKSAAAALRAMYPEEVPGKVVPLGGDLIEMDELRCKLKAEIKDAEERVELIDQTLKAAIGDAQAGYLPNGVAYTFKKVERAAYTVAAGEYRTLRRSAPKRGR